VTLADLTERSAVVHALAEYTGLGRAGFLDRYGFGRASRYFVFNSGRLYDAEAIAGAAIGYQSGVAGTLGPDLFSAGGAGANDALRRLGLEVVDARPDTIAGELRWRQCLKSHLDEFATDGSVSPTLLRDLGVYGGGAQGVWVDSRRTAQLAVGGLAVGVLHTGIHYADDLDEHGIFYHYPNTRRPAGRDRAEVEAMKACGAHSLPIFVISKPTPNSKVRGVQLGWVAGWDDAAERVLMTFDASAPRHLITDDHSDARPFELFKSRSRRATRPARARPGQQAFKLAVFKRYGARCPLSGVAVFEMLDAAHIIPDAAFGTDDPRNGLPLNAALHRAFDANLFGINPDTLKVETADKPGLTDLGISNPSLEHLDRPPAAEALRWRYDQWRATLT
jgi:putative restriction endonuclease